MLLEVMSGCRVGQSRHRASVGLRLQMPLQAGGETKSGLKRHTYVLILACFCAISPHPFSFLFFIQMESTIICLGLRWFSVTAKLTATGSQRERERVQWISLFDVLLLCLSHSSIYHLIHSAWGLSNVSSQSKGPSSLKPICAFQMSAFVMFYCRNLWLIITLHISWITVCVCVCVLSTSKSLSPLSAIKSVCSLTG